MVLCSTIVFIFYDAFAFARLDKASVPRSLPSSVRDELEMALNVFLLAYA